MQDFRVFASCHNHSTFSDGEYTPETLVRIAKCLGHGGIILTDHDTIRGLPRMKAACDKYGLITTSGCEFTTAELMPDGKLKGAHLCGFDFDTENKELLELCQYASSIQTERTKLMFKWGKERGTLREGVEWSDVVSDHPEHDYICNNEVFASFLKRGIYLYSEYETEFQKPNFSYGLGLEEEIHGITGKSYNDIKTSEVIGIIKRAGGVPVIAHPYGAEKYINEYVRFGVMGFEVRHSMLDEGMRLYYTEICDKYGLYKMGGQDHENVLGGLLSFESDEYVSPYESSGIDKENFMKLINRELG